MSEVDIRKADIEEREEIMVLIDVLHRGTLEMRLRPGTNELDPHDSGKLMTALTMFAGAICGELIACGLIPTQQRRKVTESMTRNFRQGVDAGLRKVARVAAEEGMTQ